MNGKLMDTKIGKMREYLGKEFELTVKVACYEGQTPVEIKKKATFIGCESSTFHQYYHIERLASENNAYSGHFPRLVFDVGGKKCRLYFDIAESGAKNSTPVCSRLEGRKSYAYIRM